jgi:hypothetical protein
MAGGFAVFLAAVQQKAIQYHFPTELFAAPGLRRVQVLMAWSNF